MDENKPPEFVAIWGGGAWYWGAGGRLGGGGRLGSGGLEFGVSWLFEVTSLVAGKIKQLLWKFVPNFNN